jgi:hypothetical protein
MIYNILMEVQDSIPISPRVNDFLKFFVSYFSDWLCVLFTKMAVLASRRPETREGQVFTDQNGNPARSSAKCPTRKKIAIFLGPSDSRYQASSRQPGAAVFS